MGERQVKLVDASSWIEFLRGRTSEPSLRVKSLLSRGQAAWCDLTLVELWNGARGQAEKSVLEALEGEVRLYPITEQAWARAASFERKQKWKELPGNRYTPEELKLMAENFGPFTIHKRRKKVMFID